VDDNDDDDDDDDQHTAVRPLTFISRDAISLHLTGEISMKRDINTDHVIRHCCKGFQCHCIKGQGQRVTAIDIL